MKKSIWIWAALLGDLEFMDYLLGTDRGAPLGSNGRGTAYYTDKAAKPKGDRTFQNGLSLNADGRGSLWDPWGNQYRIRLDTNDDSKVADPRSNEPIAETVLIWSAGEDGDFETWKDNPKTW